MSDSFYKQLTAILKRVTQSLSLPLHRGFPNPGHWPQPRDKGISEDEAEYLLRNDIEEVVAALDDRTPWWNTLPDHKRIVMASMTNSALAGSSSSRTCSQPLRWERPRGRRPNA